MPKGIYKRVKGVNCGREINPTSFGKRWKMPKGYKYPVKRIDVKKKISKALKGRMPKFIPNNKGRKRTEGFKEKDRLSHLGKRHTIRSKEKIRKAIINNPNRVFKNTSIELKVEEELIKRNINYQKHMPLCNVAIVDFYLPEYRIIIQCDGNYWHNYPYGLDKDRMQDRILTFNGFNVYRFWEHEINESVEKCLNKILIN